TLEGRIRSIEGVELSAAEGNAIERELADIQEQLEYHQSRVDSYESGRGFIAAEGRSALPEIPIPRRDLHAVPGVLGKEWTIAFYAKRPDGSDIFWGQCSVLLDEDGRPDSPPNFVLEARLTRDGKQHALHFYEDVQVAEGASASSGVGQRIPATSYALDTM